MNLQGHMITPYLTTDKQALAFHSSQHWHSHQEPWGFCFASILVNTWHLHFGNSSHPSVKGNPVSIMSSIGEHRPHVCWPFVYFLWKNAYSYLSPFFNWAVYPLMWTCKHCVQLFSELMDRFKPIMQLILFFLWSLKEKEILPDNEQPSRNVRSDNLFASKEYTIPAIFVWKPILQTCIKVRVRLSFLTQCFLYAEALC